MGFALVSRVEVVIYQPVKRWGRRYRFIEDLNGYADGIGQVRE